MSCGHGIGRDVFGVRVFVFLYVCGVGDGGLTCFQVAVRSLLVAAMELDGTFWGACVCVLVRMGVGDSVLTYLQVVNRSPWVAAMELDGTFSGCVFSCSCMYAGSGMAGSPVCR